MPSSAIVRNISRVAASLGIHERHIEPYGHHKAKVALEAIGDRGSDAPRLVLVSALTPTTAGEGKTTISVGLAMAMQRLGRRTVVCLREPSLGPVFGMKGGGTGGGASQLYPSDDINLHFNGDFHAITTAHNLLAALVDHELYFDGPSHLDPRRIYWPRVIDMDDRSLRHIVIGLGNPSDGVVREARFDITAASEIMASLCLAECFDGLRTRLGRMVVGRSKEGKLVTAGELRAVDALLVLLLDAIKPNLVQTAEGTPALVHGGPFANIAHGCSSLLATRIGLTYAEDVITEAGFGFDLGGEKFLHLKCRSAGLWPRCVVLVVTARGLAHHGRPCGENRSALERGLAHLDRQIDNVHAFGLEPIVAINVFDDDSADALAVVESHCKARGAAVSRVTAFSEGSAGAVDLAELVTDALKRTDSAPPTPRYLYDLEAPFIDKVRAVAVTLYGAGRVTLTAAAARDLQRFADAGYGALPVCIAKTQLSLTSEPNGGVLQEGFTLEISSVRLSAGAGFLVALAGDVSTMPGLPREPAAQRIRIDSLRRAKFA